MGRITGFSKRSEKILTQWISAHSILFLKISIGIIFLWFGALKFFPDFSPAENLAVRTIEKLTSGMLSGKTPMTVLAVWECLIGIGFMSGKCMRSTLILLFLQMIGTIMPLFMFPDLTFSVVPFVPTLEGPYIIKNLVIISAGIVLSATVKGGKVVADPKIAEAASKEEEAKVEELKRK